MNTSLPADHADRMERTRLALTGLSVGDALGQTCFRDHNYEAILEDPRATANGPWPFTDDTAMAISIYEVLNEHGRIDQDALAQRFAARYKSRSRGAGTAVALTDFWNKSVTASRGALRPRASSPAAPSVTAARCGSPRSLRTSRKMIIPWSRSRRGSRQRSRTHTMRASRARLPRPSLGRVRGGIARRTEEATRRELFDVALSHTPPGLVRDGIERARTFTFDLSTEPVIRLLGHIADVVSFDASIEPVVRLLGNGSHISCQDTVPFCLWVAAMHLHDYQTAIVQTIRARGDIDTNCAIVGGIVALAVGEKGIPDDWLAQREELVV